MELEWKAPPVAIRGPRSKIQGILAELKKKPGQWARVDKAMKTSSGSTKWKKHGCEAVSRTTGTPGEWDVYACWPLPEDESDEAAPVAAPEPPVVKASAKPAPAPAATPVPVAASKMPEAATAARWPETSNLDPDDPQDQYLARQRAKLEADRKERQARAERMQRAKNAVSR